MLSSNLDIDMHMPFSVGPAAAFQGILDLASGMRASRHGRQWSDVEYKI